MKRSRVATLLCLTSALGFAGSWSGALVDAACYAARERNVNPTDTMIYVDRDTNDEIRYCSPGSKTKVFAVIQPDGTTFKLDAAGNDKAAELVRKTGRKSRFVVLITGEIGGNALKVDSISAAQ